MLLQRIRRSYGPDWAPESLEDYTTGNPAEQITMLRKHIKSNTFRHAEKVRAAVDAKVAEAPPAHRIEDPAVLHIWNQWLIRNKKEDTVSRRRFVRHSGIR